MRPRPWRHVRALPATRRPRSRAARRGEPAIRAGSGGRLCPVGVRPCLDGSARCCEGAVSSALLSELTGSFATMVSMQAVEHENRHRILVVDDEPSIVDAVATALRYEDYLVEEAGTGREALSAVARFDPDLIVLDWML